MKNTVYIRPLKVEDAQTSYAWRNNPRIWRLTGSRPDRQVTLEMEREWITNALKRPNETRFAICCSDSDTYIGNVFLTDMDSTSAYIHIFIGDINYWGDGRAFTAVTLLLEHSFENLGLDAVYTDINKRNVASLALAKSCGFKYLDERFEPKINADLAKYVYTKQMFADFHKRKEVVR